MYVCYMLFNKYSILNIVNGVVWTVRPGPLRECPNLLLTPGTARYSDQGLLELRQMAADEMRRAVIGQLPASLPHCVNAHLLTAARQLG